MIHTRGRAPAVPPAPSAADADHTRLRADRPAAPAADTAAPAPRWRRPLILAAAGLIVLAGGLGIAAALGSVGRDEPPPAAAAATPDVPITLAEPVDDGASVTLSWTASGTLDYGVVVAAEGAAPSVSLADRRTTLTVPVEPGTRYCFQIQGTDGRGGVVESNVVSVRGAVCRF